MSDNINIISINPGRKTFGEMNLEMARMDVSAKSKAGSSTLKRFKSVINFLSGINPGVTAKWSTKILFLRLIAGATLMATGFLNYFGEFSYNVPSMLIILGSILIIGLFTRVLSILGAALFATVMATTYMGVTLPYLPQTIVPFGELNYAYLLCSVLLLICAMIGPGRFSIDQMIRTGAFSIKRNKIKKRNKKAMRKSEKQAEMRMTYKAFQYS